MITIIPLTIFWRYFDSFFFFEDQSYSVAKVDTAWFTERLLNSNRFSSIHCEILIYNILTRIVCVSESLEFRTTPYINKRLNKFRLQVENDNPSAFFTLVKMVDDCLHFDENPFLLKMDYFDEILRRQLQRNNCMMQTGMNINNIETAF